MKSKKGAKEKETETEKGQEHTKVFYGGENIIEVVLQFLYKTDNIYACVDYTRPSIAIDYEVLRKPFISAKKRGVKLMYVTEITRDNISYCKQLMSIVDELRHLDGIKGNFYISREAYLAPALYHKRGKPAEQIIYTNVKEIVEHQKFVFDSFWDRAIPAEQRIREIEEGIQPSHIEIIQNPKERINRAYTLMQCAEEEISVLFPTINAVRRQVGMGVASSFNDAKERGVKVKVLIPSQTAISNSHTASEMSKEKEDIQKSLKKLSLVDVRYFEQANLQTYIGMLIVDKNKCLILELYDDTKESSYQSIGLAAYSNSKTIASSYAAIFESLWKQTELYEQIKLANQQLEMRDKIQQDFINTAAHELRGPIQPILGLSDFLLGKSEGNLTQYKDLIGVIRRSAKRLQRLTEDILDVARIESRLLILKKCQFSLNELILNVIADLRSQIKNGNKIKIDFLLKQTYDQSKNRNNYNNIVLRADPDRLSEVLSNLLTNAIRFTEHGTIVVSVEINANDQVIVAVEDTGLGIDPEIMPRLFSKFATKPGSGGTGLGLFISKNIIEAHGGKIWAENNPNGKGATFTFSLPLSKLQ